MVELRVGPGNVCDFCSDEEPHYIEDCETFEAWALGPGLEALPIGISEGGWSSCVPCHEMIKARKWHTLQRRAVDAMVRKYPDMPKNRVQHGVEIIHGAFRAHKPVSSLNP